MSDSRRVHSMCLPTSMARAYALALPNVKIECGARM
jgi:hypothetical protein